MKSYGLDMLGPLVLERVETLPTWTAAMEGRIIYNEADTTVYLATSSGWTHLGSGGGSISDEAYDPTTWDGIATVGASKNALRDKYFSTDEIINKLLPAKPPYLSDVVLVITPDSGSIYNANRSSGTTIQTISPGVLATAVDILDDPKPSGVSAREFYDGNNGELSGKVDNLDGGHRTLTTSSDVGTYIGLSGRMEITKDADYYSGQGTPKEGFWWALLAKVTPNSSLGIGEHLYALIHSMTGTSQKAWILDDPSTPNITGYSVSPGSTTAKWLSGVPSVNAGDTFSCTFNVNNAVSECYNPTQIAQIISSAIQATINLNFSSTPSKGDVLFVSGNTQAQVGSGVYTENAQFTFRGYNSKGETGEISTSSGVRVDTVSPLEQADYDNHGFSDQPFRVQSGTGMYPANTPINYGDVFDPIQSLELSSELQLINGKVQWPPASNYSSNIPLAGPNYLSLSGESYPPLSDVRWYTRKLGSVTAITGFTITIEGSENFSSVVETDMILQAKVAGVTGWVDVNLAYPGTGNPNGDGDAALVVGSSTGTTKRGTFGSAAKTGDLYIRIGIPKSSSKKFSSIKLLAVS